MARARTVGTRYGMSLLLVGALGAGAPFLTHSRADVLRAGPPANERELESPPTANALGRYRGEISDWDPAVYVKRGGTFYDMVKGQGWHGWLRERKCRSWHPSCWFGHRGSGASVEAIYDADKIPVVLPVGVKGVVIGRYVNTGDHTDHALEIPASDNRAYPDQYYLVIAPGSRTAARMFIAHVQFDDAGKAKDDMPIEEARDGYASCGHPRDAKDRGVADFSDCDHKMPHKKDGTGSLDGKKDRDGDTADTGDSLGWFSCDDGCCTAKWPPSVSRRK